MQKTDLRFRFLLEIIIETEVTDAISEVTVK